MLEASGQAVGLPSGQMGNSEVGHMNIGAGRIVYQPLEFINQAIEDRSFYKKEGFLKVFDHVKKNHSTLHIMGLLSDGGVHSHINHLMALIDLCKEQGVEKFVIMFIWMAEMLIRIVLKLFRKIRAKNKRSWF